MHSNLEPLSKLAMDLDSEPEETADLMQEEDEAGRDAGHEKAIRHPLDPHVRSFPLFILFLLPKTP